MAGTTPPDVQTISTLQRTIGNAAVARMLAPHGTSQLTVQRARVNLRPATAAAAGTISGVSNWPARPASNLRGSQGQHLTAYVVFEDSVLNRVVDRTPQQAAETLREMLDEFGALPGLNQQNAAYLRAAIEESKVRLAAAGTAADPVALGAEIDTILAIRNQVPGTAEHGVGGGHGESGRSALLMQVEPALRRHAWDASWVAATVADQVRQSMWGLLDYNPAIPKDDAGQKTIAKHLLSHYLSLRTAYPCTFAWLTDNDFYLVEYFERHRGEAGMPLEKLVAGDYDLDPIFEAVHAGL